MWLPFSKLCCAIQEQLDLDERDFQDPIEYQNFSYPSQKYSKALKMVASKVADLAKWWLVFGFQISLMAGLNLAQWRIFLLDIVKSILLYT